MFSANSERDDFAFGRRSRDLENSRTSYTTRISEKTLDAYDETHRLAEITVNLTAKDVELECGN